MKKVLTCVGVLWSLAVFAAAGQGILVGLQEKR